MSEPVSALQGASFEGLATITEQGPRGMITLRGDLGDAGFAKAVKKHTGLAIPGQRLVETAGDKSLLWMSPDELLLLCPYAEAVALADTLAQALDGQHALVANVSDARAVFSISGAHTRDVLAKLTPADLAPEALPVGELRRSRLAQVAAAFWMQDAESALLICFRSVAPYVFELLKTAAQPDSAVGYH